MPGYIFSKISIQGGSIGRDFIAGKDEMGINTSK